MKMILTNHAQERMTDRNITRAMIIEALQKGKLVNDDRVELKFDKNRSRLIVCIVAKGNKIIVKTAFIRGRLDNGVK